MKKRTLGSIIGLVSACGIVLTAQLAKTDALPIYLNPQSAINTAAADKTSYVGWFDLDDASEQETKLLHKKSRKQEESVADEALEADANQEPETSPVLEPKPSVRHTIVVKDEKKEGEADKQDKRASGEEQADKQASEDQPAKAEKKTETAVPVEKKDKAPASKAPAKAESSQKAASSQKTTSSQKATSNQKAESQPKAEATKAANSKPAASAASQAESKAAPTKTTAAASTSTVAKLPDAAGSQEQGSQPAKTLTPATPVADSKAAAKAPAQSASSSEAITDVKDKITAWGADTTKDRKGTPMTVNTSQKMVLSDLPDLAAAKTMVAQQPESRVSYVDLRYHGVINWGGYKFTFYSQSVLPGGGLKIPGRHIDGGYVCDADGYIVLANDAPRGTIIPTPFSGKYGKVYDRGTTGNHFDVYVE